MAELPAIAHVDAEHGFSGGEVQVMLLVDGLQRRGYRNVIFAPSGSEILAAATKRKIDTRAVRMRNEADVASMFTLARGFRSSGADLVHLHTGRATWLGGLAARLVGLPAITTRRMDRPIRPGVRTRLVYEYLTRRVAAISPGVVRCLEEGGVPSERIVLVPSAVDPEQLRPTRPRDSVRDELGTGSSAIAFLVMARLTRRKGIDVLIDAVSNLAESTIDFALWIAGDGPERAPLEDRARRSRCADRVKFLGRRNDKADLLAACDVLVMPSRQEGLGVAALEAMAVGRPVVGSRVGGLQDAVVDERTGLLVPGEDVVALANALCRIALDTDLRRRLGEAGPGRVAEGFLASQMVDAYTKLYAEVLGSR